MLWHTEVEGQKPADIAPLLGMSANSVSALAYRAREGLRQAFLTQHVGELAPAGDVLVEGDREVGGGLHELLAHRAVAEHREVDVHAAAGEGVELQAGCLGEAQVARGVALEEGGGESRRENASP